MNQNGPKWTEQDRNGHQNGSKWTELDTGMNQNRYSEQNLVLRFGNKFTSSARMRQALGASYA